MSKTMKRILAVIISLTVLLAYFYISAQAPEITRYTSKHNPALSQDENMNAWLSGYLRTHQSKLNQKAPLIDYKIEALKSIDPVG
ncbi:hypothetical protein MX850_01580 [Erysipelothrix sp. Poltava]|nr:hypothetical protein MX850_01580 [Erysipelothrix sp. Poltava]